MNENNNPFRLEPEPPKQFGDYIVDLLRYICFIGLIGLIIFGIILVIESASKAAEKERIMETMTYCERLDYKIKNTNIRKHHQSFLLEKYVALQSGECGKTY